MEVVDHAAIVSNGGCVMDMPSACVSCCIVTLASSVARVFTVREEKFDVVQNEYTYQNDNNFNHAYEMLPDSNEANELKYKKSNLHVKC